MNPNTGFTLSVALEIISLQFAAYLVYIRLRRRSILRKLSALLVSSVILVFSTRSVLYSSSSHSILIAGPVACLLLYGVILAMTYEALGKLSKPSER